MKSCKRLALSKLDKFIPKNRKILFPIQIYHSIRSHKASTCSFDGKVMNYRTNCHKSCPSLALAKTILKTKLWQGVSLGYSLLEETYVKISQKEQIAGYSSIKRKLKLNSYVESNANRRLINMGFVDQSSRILAFSQRRN